MGWGNAANVVTTNLDAAGDSPAAARADLKAALDEVKNVINGRAAADGVASLDSTGKVPDGQLNERHFDRRAEYIGAGAFTWTVPAGIQYAKLAAQGVGGSGAYRNDGNCGAGGGGGAYVEVVVAVTPGWVFTITIPAPGAAPAANNVGNAGAAEVVITGPVGSGIVLRAGAGQGGGIVGDLNSPGQGGGIGISAPTPSYISHNGGDGDRGGVAYKTRGGGSHLAPPMWVGLGGLGIGGGGGSTGLAVAAQMGGLGAAFFYY